MDDWNCWVGIVDWMDDWCWMTRWMISVGLEDV